MAQTLFLRTPLFAIIKNLFTNFNCIICITVYSVDVDSVSFFFFVSCFSGFRDRIGWISKFFKAWEFLQGIQKKYILLNINIMVFSSCNRKLVRDPCTWSKIICTVLCC